MLTIAALHTMNDTSDPYFTVLQAGSYAKNKPSGTPCDAAFPCGSHGLSKGATIAIAVVVTVVGLAIFGLCGWWAFLVRRRRNKIKGGEGEI